jgi:hypothetical protein
MVKRERVKIVIDHYIELYIRKVSEYTTPHNSFSMGEKKWLSV